MTAALLQVLEERPDLFRDLLADVIEDVAFAHAIQVGEAGEFVTRDEVFRSLNGE